MSKNELTWLDIYPPEDGPPPPPLPPRPKKPSPALLSRIAALRTLLADIAENVKIREQLIIIHHGKPVLARPDSQKWKKRALCDNRIYYSLQKQVDEIGDMATKKQVEKWEDEAADLRRWAKSELERVVEDNSWNDFEIDEGKALVEGWSWEKADGKGPGLDEEVDPKDGEKKNENEDAGRYCDLYAGFFKGFK